MKIGIYPGAFDPPTLGHLDIIKRSYKMFDKLIILIMNNNSKKSLLNFKTKNEYLKKMTLNFQNNINIISFNNSLIEYIKKFNKKNHIYIIRGIRNQDDFTYEQNMYLINKALYNNFETIFLFTNNKFNFISSSAVKELLNYNLNIDKFIHKSIIEDLYKKFWQKANLIN